MKTAAIGRLTAYGVVLAMVFAIAYALGSNLKA